MKIKKPSKKTLKRKADKLFSAYIRNRGVCQWCGKSDDTLQTAHIFSRRFLVTRWDELNALCLDAKCHFRAHAEPLEFAEFVRKHLGDQAYNDLRRKAKTCMDKVDLQEIIKKLEAL